MVSEIIENIKGQGYTKVVHNIRCDLKALLPIHQQLEINKTGNTRFYHNCGARLLLSTIFSETLFEDKILAYKHD